MSKFDNIDKKKIALKKASSLAKEQLISDLEVAKERTGKLGRNIVIIGGVLTISYVLVKTLTGGDGGQEEKKAGIAKSVKYGLTDQIVRGLRKELGIFLLGLAKRRLMDYFNENRYEDREDITISK